MCKHTFSYICIFYSRHKNRNSTTTQQSPRVETTKTNKREFYFFYFSLFFYDLYWVYRFFFYTFFSTSSFLVFFLHFTSRIQTHTRNRRHFTCTIIIIVIIRVTIQHERRLSGGWWKTVWYQWGWVGTENNASFNRRLISKG